MPLIKCPDCNKEISSSAPTCPNCGRPMQLQQILCPNCKSPDIERISGVSKAGSALMWGVLSMGKLTKTYQCKKCKYRW
jgi:uncharacterized OB-fold protein